MKNRKLMIVVRYDEDRVHHSIRIYDNETKKGIGFAAKELARYEIVKNHTVTYEVDLYFNDDEIESKAPFTVIDIPEEISEEKLDKVKPQLTKELPNLLSKHLPKNPEPIKSESSKKQQTETLDLFAGLL